MLSISSVDQGLQRGDSSLWRIYGLPLRIYGSYLLRFGSRLQGGVEVLGGSLLNILKGRYLLKRRKVIIGLSLGNSRGRVID